MRIWVATYVNDKVADFGSEVFLTEDEARQFCWEYADSEDEVPTKFATFEEFEI